MGRPQPPVEMGHGGHPGAGELEEKHRPVERGDTAPHRWAIGGVGDAAAGAVGRQQLGQYRGDAREAARERCGVVGAVGVQQHLGMAGGQLVAALLRWPDRVVAGQVAGGGLLLEPLAGVARSNADSCGDLELGCGSEVVERLVEPELQAQVDAEGLQGLGGGIDQSLGQRLARIQVGVGGHGSSVQIPSTAATRVDLGV